jgi:hypothetical protein
LLESFKKESVAYIIFLSTFSVWVGLLVATFMLTNSLVFPNALMFAAFIVSGGAAGVSCGFVGLSILGFGLNLKDKQVLKQEKVGEIIVEKSNQSALEAQKRKRAKVAKAPNLLSAVADSAIEEPPQLTSKVQKRKKAKATKAPNLNVSILGLIEEEKLKQKT